MLDTHLAAVTLLALAFGYLCGSVPFGLLLTQLAGTADVRTIASGNIGATNVLRTGRKDLAAGTLLLDAAKGTVAVLLARAAFGESAAIAAAAGAFVGHIAPVWLHFRGGKGVATFLGGMIGLAWPAALVFIVVWLAMAAATRFSSAAALAGSVAALIASGFLLPPPAVFVLAMLTALLWWKHRENIRRLRAGTESRIGAKS